MRFSDSHHFRKMVAGVCMVVGPALVLLGFIVSPPIHTNAGKQLAAFATHQDRTLISTLLAFAAIAFLIVATLGLMHMMRDRMTGYGHAGGGLAIVGFVMTAAFFGAGLLLWQMTKDGVQASDIRAFHDLTHGTAGVIFLGIVPWFAALGFVVLAAGLYRAKAVDWWMSALMAIGMIGINLATPLESVGFGIAAAAVLLVGMGSIGTMVLRETDAEWDQTPEYAGFRPAMHMHMG